MSWFRPRDLLDQTFEVIDGVLHYVYGRD